MNVGRFRTGRTLLPIFSPSGAGGKPAWSRGGAGRRLWRSRREGGSNPPPATTSTGDTRGTGDDVVCTAPPAAV
ncbi:MAG: hypothetical protein ACK55I_48270, partial [bacterium]